MMDVQGAPSERVLGGQIRPHSHAALKDGAMNFADVQALT